MNAPSDVPPPRYTPDGTRHPSDAEATIVTEIAMLQVKPGQAEEFETAFRTAAPIIASMPGYLAHELLRCLEQGDRYALLVRWQTIEDHTLGFRGSPRYTEWRELLHHFYDPFPTVEHFARVDAGVDG